MKRDVIKFNNSGKLVATGNDVLMTSTHCLTCVLYK